MTAVLTDAEKHNLKILDATERMAQLKMKNKSYGDGRSYVTHVSFIGSRLVKGFVFGSRFLHFLVVDGKHCRTKSKENGTVELKKCAKDVRKTKEQRGFGE